MLCLCARVVLYQRHLGRRFNGCLRGVGGQARFLWRRRCRCGMSGATSRLIFSGEEFPESGTFATLKQRGHTIEAQGPNYLVHRYEEESDFPKQLNGRFHGVVADRTRETVTLFNDRFGLQRLYYYEAQDGFYFAAEAKAILKVRPELRAVDARGLGEFIACGCVLENRTLFSGIHILPPGSAWVFGGGSLKEKRSLFPSPGVGRTTTAPP